MQPVALYFHGFLQGIDPDRLKKRHTFLKAATGQTDIGRFRSADTPAQFAENLKGIPDENLAESRGAVVIFFHLTPMEGLSGGLAAAIENATGATARIFFVLVSGEAISYDSKVSLVMDAAKRKKFGGMTYWPYAFDSSAPQLIEAWGRIVTLFQDGRRPTFDAFHLAIHPVNVHSDVAAGILAQLVEFATVKAADLEPFALRFIEKWRAASGDRYSVPDSEKWAIAELIRQAAANERLRARLRHHDLGNRLLQALERVRQTWKGDVVDPDSESDLFDLLKGGREQLRTELEQVTESYKQLAKSACLATHAPLLCACSAVKIMESLLPSVSSESLTTLIVSLDESLQQIEKVLTQKEKHIDVSLTALEGAITACSAVIAALAVKGPIN
jgi:hypothetical protein